MPGRGLLHSIVAGAGMLLASVSPAPVLADVKAGADAWARGGYARAVKKWDGPAARGEADAEFNLGQAHKLGHGVPRDLARAEILFGKAAAKGHAAAADNYGCLPFDRGERASAMPYIQAASDRGDPCARYLQGLAHFNGDLASPDWVRASALVTRAHTAGVAQAAAALQQMDEFIPLTQRREAGALALQPARQAHTGDELQAGGYQTRTDASATCAVLAASRLACVPTRD
ncbi:MAG: hypothetical protein V4579_09120 [Pseudomonadota bacterium]